MILFGKKNFPEKHLVALKKWVLSKFFFTKLLLVENFDPYKIYFRLTVSGKNLITTN